MKYWFDENFILNTRQPQFQQSQQPQSFIAPSSLTLGDSLADDFLRPPSWFAVYNRKYKKWSFLKLKKSQKFAWFMTLFLKIMSWYYTH